MRGNIGRQILRITLIERSSQNSNKNFIHSLFFRWRFQQHNNLSIRITRRWALCLNVAFFAVDI